MIKKKICKLFYRMDMFYLIMNKKPTFYLKRWALGGGLAYIYISTSINGNILFVACRLPMRQDTGNLVK